MTGDLLARIEADRVAARAALADERAALRLRFPQVAQIVNAFREALAADPHPPRLLPRPVYATNAAGEEWGSLPRAEGIAVDGDKLAQLPAFEASWRAFYAKQPDKPTDYRERMQRSIRPDPRGITP